MATPPGTRVKKIRSPDNDAVHVYSNGCGIVLQVRRSVPTELDVTAVSFKVGVNLSPTDVLAKAGELLTVASQQLQKAESSSEQQEFEPAGVDA